MEQTIVTHILQAFPTTQAIYVFGSFGTVDERLESDIDIAIVLPYDIAKHAATPLHEVSIDLMLATGRPVDLVNLRHVDTILQFEIISTGRRIAAPQRHESDLYELVILKTYQLFTVERADIVAHGLHTGRFYARR
jgi:predicted nucleotidyltransferase